MARPGYSSPDSWPWEGKGLLQTALRKQHRKQAMCPAPAPFCCNHCDQQILGAKDPPRCPVLRHLLSPVWCQQGVRQQSSSKQNHKLSESFYLPSTNIIQVLVTRTSHSFSFLLLDLIYYRSFRDVSRNKNSTNTSFPRLDSKRPLLAVPS